MKICLVKITDDYTFRHGVRYNKDEKQNII